MIVLFTRVLIFQIVLSITLFVEHRVAIAAKSSSYNSSSSSKITSSSGKSSYGSSNNSYSSSSSAKKQEKKDNSSMFNFGFGNVPIDAKVNKRNESTPFSTKTSSDISSSKKNTAKEDASKLTQTKENEKYQNKLSLQKKTDGDNSKQISKENIQNLKQGNIQDKDKKIKSVDARNEYNKKAKSIPQKSNRSQKRDYDYEYEEALRNDPYMQYLIEQETLRRLTPANEMSRDGDIFSNSADVRQYERIDSVDYDVRNLTPGVAKLMDGDPEKKLDMKLILDDGKDTRIKERALIVQDKRNERKDWLGVLRRKKKPKDISEVDIPRTSSAGTLESKKPRNYISVAGAFMPYGSATIVGQDIVSSAGTGTEDTNISTYTGTVTYQPSGVASMRFGTQRPFFGGVRFPSFYRMELDISYYRLRGQIGFLSPSPDYPGKEAGGFPYPPCTGGVECWTPAGGGSWFANLITVGANGYFDMAKVGPGYPYIGGGAAVGINLTDNGYLKTAPVLLFNVYAGYMLNISSKFSMSIGYKLSIILPTSYTLGYDGVISGPGNNNAAQQQLMGFGTVLLQQIEVTMFFF